MHQVISYESAMHPNNSPLSPEYITKRKCLRFVLSVAIFTMISGFLLGKFISDRNHFVQQLLADTAASQDENSIQLSSADFKNLKQLRSYEQTKDALLAAARQLTGELQRHASNFRPSSLNSEIFNKYVSCTQDIPPNTNSEPSTFIEELISNTAARQQDCMRIIKMIIDNNLANG